MRLEAQNTYFTEMLQKTFESNFNVGNEGQDPEIKKNINHFGGFPE